MSRRCATRAEVLDIAPELRTYGTESTDTITVASQPSPGDFVTLRDDSGPLPRLVSLVADTDFTIGANVSATASALAAAFNADASTFVTATAVDGVVYLASVSTGAEGLLSLSSSVPAVMVPASDTFEGGTAAIDEFISCTCRMINLEYWGNKASCGHAYLAAHYATIASDDGGEVGPVTARTLDKLSESYASSASSDVDFGSTRYGRLYVQMRKTLVVAPIVARGRLPFLC